MQHKLELQSFINQSITVIEDEKKVVIKVETNNVYESVTLTQKELYSFISTLLHVQQKMK